MTKILIDRAMIEQALEALEKINKLSVGENAICLPAEIDGAMDALRAALAEPVQKPPKWKLVPTEPTIGMCIAGDEARQNVDDLTRTPAIYRAMIAAAPAAQEQTEPVATFDKVWNAIDWDKWRKEPIRELVQMIHSKTSPRAAQGREPVQEPVAWIQRNHLEQAQRQPFLCRVEPTQRMQDFVALYTAPPQRKPLTDEWAEKLIRIYDGGNSDVRNAMRGLKRAIEAAHNIKE